MIERAIRIAAPLSLLVIWELLVRTHVLDARFFPAPSAIAGDFVAFARSGDMATNTLATFERIAVGFVIGAIPGVVLGRAVGINRWVAAYFEPVISILYPIPKIAVLPLVLLVFGIGEASKYALVAIGVFFLMAINTAAGVRQIDRTAIDVARAYRLRMLTMYTKVLLPGSLPNIFAGAKLSIGIAIVLAVAAEFTAAKSGLGYTIWNGWETLQVERMYVALVVVSLLGYLLSSVVDLCERWLAPWAGSRR